MARYTHGVGNTSPRRIRKFHARRVARFALPACCAWSVIGFGCLPTTRLPNHPIQKLTDSSSGRPYQLYIPSTYSDRHTWPVVVACHGTPPYDTATFQMQEWALFAEDQGIIIIAPQLVGTKGDFPPAPAEQIKRQREDENAILSIVDSVKREYRVAEEQVFMVCWSAGSYAILYTGLRNPGAFRALMIRQGNFDVRFMDVADENLDRWQKILVIKGNMDMIVRKQTDACIEWLRGRGQIVDTDEITGSHRRIDPGAAWTFFREIVKERPWIRIRTMAPNPEKPLTVLFGLDAVPPVKQVKWFFGDQHDSRDVSPTHTYEAPGEYRVTVNAELTRGGVFRRQKTISVGRSRD